VVGLEGAQYFGLLPASGGAGGSAALQGMAESGEQRGESGEHSTCKAEVRFDPTHA
jgi:hypothetical protein